MPLSSPAMAQRKQQQQKDVLQRLADSGEEALQKFIGELPGGSKVVGAMNSLLARVDELSKRMRSLDPLERRVAELERRLDALSKPKPAAKKTTATARRRKPAASSSRTTASS
jgi:outer membrane murein-binding lipoprotein Lpp